MSPAPCLNPPVYSIYAFLSIMPNISLKSNVYVRCSPCGKRLKSLCGFVALLKHFQSWDHRGHRCRDACRIFVSLFLSQSSVFFLACHLLSVYFNDDLIIFLTLTLSNKSKYAFAKELLHASILTARRTAKLLLWSQILAVFLSLSSTNIR